MAQDNRRRYDDDDELSIRKKDGGRGLLIGLAIGGAALILATCLCGVGIALAFILSADDTASKLPGSWKGRFIIVNQVIDTTYIFEKDGSFREETVDFGGLGVRVSKGHWGYHDGRVEITWNNGSFEDGTVRWIDDRTIDYRIVNHIQPVQIGAQATLKRQ
jgi:hypothetical protein